MAIGIGLISLEYVPEPDETCQHSPIIRRIAAPAEAAGAPVPARVAPGAREFRALNGRIPIRRVLRWRDSVSMRERSSSNASAKRQCKANEVKNDPSNEQTAHLLLSARRMRMNLLNVWSLVGQRS